MSQFKSNLSFRADNCGQKFVKGTNFSFRLLAEAALAIACVLALVAEESFTMIRCGVDVLAACARSGHPCTRCTSVDTARKLTRSEMQVSQHGQPSRCSNAWANMSFSRRSDRNNGERTPTRRSSDESVNSIAGKTWGLSHSEWNRLMHALHGNGSSIEDAEVPAFIYHMCQMNESWTRMIDTMGQMTGQVKHMIDQIELNKMNGGLPPRECPVGHGFASFNTLEDHQVEFECDQCGIDIVQDSIVLDCALCKYSLCESCRVALDSSTTISTEELYEMEWDERAKVTCEVYDMAEQDAVEKDDESDDESVDVVLYRYFDKDGRSHLTNNPPPTPVHRKVLWADMSEDEDWGLMRLEPKEERGTTLERCAGKERITCFTGSVVVGNGAGDGSGGGPGRSSARRSARRRANISN